MSAISRIGDHFAQNARELGAYVAAVEADRLPIVRGLSLDADDVLRADLIQHLMCQGEIDKRDLENRYGIHFDSYFEGALLQLPPLIEDGLVGLEDDFIRITPRGRLLMRVVAMCFDRYLCSPAQAVRFSKAI
jgi:oxygen-independent coproporphyrinogen-3 oxidase